MVTMGVILIILVHIIEMVTGRLFFFFLQDMIIIIIMIGIDTGVLHSFHVLGILGRYRVVAAVAGGGGARDEFAPHCGRFVSWNVYEMDQYILVFVRVVVVVCRYMYVWGSLGTIMFA